MSDDITPQQISAPFHKRGLDAHKERHVSLPHNPFEVIHGHAEEHAGSLTLSHVHVTDESVATFEMTPPHAKRVETPAYEKAHRYLVETQNKPCVVCGVSQTTLHDTQINRFGAQAIETHHYPIERSLVDACDPDKVHHAFPEVLDKATLLAFVDSPRNLIVLCDVHHRSTEQGIHHLLSQDFAVLPYLYDNYQIVATAKDKDICEQKDDAIEQQHGEENNFAA